MLLQFFGAAQTVTGSMHFLVHGEVDQVQQLALKLKEKGHTRVHIPARGEKAEYAP